MEVIEHAIVLPYSITLYNVYFTNLYWLQLDFYEKGKNVLRINSKKKTKEEAEEQFKNLKHLLNFIPDDKQEYMLQLCL